MRKNKLLSIIFSLFLLTSFVCADWIYNPQTGKIDYYEPVSSSNLSALGDVTLAALATGGILYYNGTAWVNLPIGAATEVLSVSVANIPDWVAAGAPGAHAASHEVGGADLVDHDVLTNFVAAEHLLTAAIDHDALLNYVAGEHLAVGAIDHDSLLNFVAGEHLAVGAIDHDALLNFVAGEHLAVGAIDHDSLLNYVAGEHLGLPNTIANVLSDWDADLDTYAAITPSANVQTLLSNATFAAFMADLSGTATAAFAWNSQNLTGINSIYMPEQAAADADIAGSGQIWVATGAPNTLWFTDEDGTDLQLGVGADAFTLKVDAGATADYFGVAGGDGLFRFTANHFTMADGGNFVTLSLADHATARTALGLQIGTDVVAWDADLDTYAGITPSANVQTLLSNATFALFLADLSATAGAAFDWGGQNLTNIGSIAPTSVDSGGVIASASHVQIEDSNELRFYEGVNYVGFEPPALGANQIWVLPAADGGNTQVMQTNGAGTLSWVNNTSGSMATDTLWAAQGDLAYGNADDVGVILSFNYDGDILRLNATVPYWDTPGISNTNPVVMNADGADDEYARFTASGLESRSVAEVLSDIGAQASNAVLTELTNLTDPGADKFVWWDDTDNDFEFSTAVTPTATGATIGSAGNAGKLEFEDADGDVLAIQVGVQAGNTTYTWPTAFGTTGYVLNSTDAGTMTWNSATDLVSAATTGAAGKSELTTTAEVSAGTDTSRAVTADALAGSTIGRKTMVWKLTASDGVVESGDNLDSILVPADFAGWLVTGVAARIITADDGADDIDIDIYNVTQTADILSTEMTIEGGEFSTLTSATPGVIDAGEDDITAADVIRIDITAYAGDNAAGLEVHITFERVT